MAIENGVIITPENLTGDIGALLQTSERNEGAICRHKNVNMWAKYKPWNAHDTEKTGKWLFITPGLDPDKDKCRWRWECKGGLKQNQTDDPFDYWEWDKPEGGEESPFRMDDFVAYKHKAIAPYTIKITNIFGEEQTLDEKSVIEVGGIKGYSYINRAENYTRIDAIRNKTDEFEYSLEDCGSQAYEHFVIVIRKPNALTSENEYPSCELSPSVVPYGTTYGASAALPLTETKPYTAGLLAYNNGFDEKETWESEPPAGAERIPVPAKNNRFTLNFVMHTIWDDAIINYGNGIQLYLYESRTIKASDGESYYCYSINGIRANVGVTFDKRYARDCFIDCFAYYGTTCTGGDSDYPIRFLLRKNMKLDTIEECIGATMSQGGWTPGGSNYGQSGSENVEYDKSEGLDFSFDKEFPFGSTGLEDTGNILYVCIKTSRVSDARFSVGAILHAYSSTTHTDMYDCGSVNEKFAREIDPTIMTTSRTWY